MKVLQWIARTLIGVFFFLTSIYGLVSFVPYTFRLLVKAPPYPWQMWFSHWHWALSIVVAVVLILLRRFAHYPRLTAAVAFTECIVFSIRHPIDHIHNDGWALLLAFFALIPVAMSSFSELRHRELEPEPVSPKTLVGFTIPLLATSIVSLLSTFAFYNRAAFQGMPQQFDRAAAEALAWSLFAHLWIAVLVVTLINVVLQLSRLLGFRSSTVLRWTSIALMAFSFAFASAMLIANTLAFQGIAAYTYVSLFGFTLAMFLIGRYLSLDLLLADPRARWIFMAISILGACYALAYTPTRVGDADWNGLIVHSETVASLLVILGSLYLISRNRQTLSIPAQIAIILVAAFVFEGMQFSSPVWASELGGDAESIHRALEEHTAHNASFDMVWSVLEHPSIRECDATCRTLEQYANIPSPHTQAVVNIVDDLKPSTTDLPNVFIITLDSLRPDYLGAYNSKVDFTPNIDQFARDSAIFRHTYSPYAGTSLAEPAVWTGAMLLHAHYVEPIANVNTLARLAKTDRYQLVVSYDTMMRQFLTPDIDCVKLDAHTEFHGFEFSKTVREFKSWYDGQYEHARPIMFYAQPMNIHQVANNDLPKRNAYNWRIRPGFNNRIAFELHQFDEFFGDFIHYLKSRGLYDKSIIVLTSDHGEATGELGRIAHSNVLYPEVMRVPLVVHLPESLRETHVADIDALASITDITPSLYYLLGHRPIKISPVNGRPLFARSAAEFAPYQRNELFFASDSIPGFGIVNRDSTLFYAVYAYPERSELYNLRRDPMAVSNVATPEAVQKYNARVFDHLHSISDFYGYKPTGGNDGVLVLGRAWADAIK